MSEFDKNLDELYETFDEVLAEADCEVTASEFQGIFAGMISAGLKKLCCQAKGTLLEVINDGHTFPKETQNTINNLFSESLRAFRDEDSLPVIMLPGDDYPLIDRLEAATLWCQGYLLGFGLQLANTKMDNPEIKEALVDISEISQLELVADESDEAKMALETLLEHIKVAVKMIYLELVFKQEQLAADSSGSVEISNSAETNKTFH